MLLYSDNEKSKYVLGITSLIGTLHHSPHENILIIAPVNIHYLYTRQYSGLSCSTQLMAALISDSRTKSLKILAKQ